MHDTAPLEHWHEFYLLLGTAAAALIALMFVAASIGVGWISPERSFGTRTFMTPIVAHYTAVLFVAALGLMPTMTWDALAVLLVASAAVGVVAAILITIGVFKRDDDWSDRLAYGFIPMIVYAAAGVAGVLFWRRWPYAPDLLAGAALALLIVNIRNAWDMTIAMAHRHVRPPET